MSVNMIRDMALHLYHVQRTDVLPPCALTSTNLSYPLPGPSILWCQWTMTPTRYRVAATPSTRTHTTHLPSTLFSCTRHTLHGCGLPPSQQLFPAPFTFKLCKNQRALLARALACSFSDTGNLHNAVQQARLSLLLNHALRRSEIDADLPPQLPNTVLPSPIYWCVCV